MFLIGFPLLVIPFAIYNMIAFLTPGVGWSDRLGGLKMPSGAEWVVTPGDILVAVTLLVLFVEILKSTRVGSRTIIDHMLSMLLLMGMVVEFLLVRQAASSTFFLMLVISFIDVLGGFTVTVRAAQRDLTVERVDQT